MAKVIGFEKKPEVVTKIATCPMCKAIIEYTQDDVREYQIQGEYIVCPNCGRWFCI